MALKCPTNQQNKVNNDDDDKDQWIPYTSDIKLRIGQTVRLVKTQRSGAAYRDTSRFGQVARIAEVPTPSVLMRMVRPSHQPVELRFSDGRVIDYEAEDLDIPVKDLRKRKRKAEMASMENSSDKDDTEAQWTPFQRGSELRVGQTVRVVQPQRSAFEYDDKRGFGKTGIIHELPRLPTFLAALSSAKPVRIRFSDGEVIAYDAKDIDVRERAKREASKKKRKSSKSSLESSSTDSEEDTQWTPYNSDCELHPGQTVRVVKKQRSNAEYKDKRGLGKVATVVKMMEVPPMIELLAKAQGTALKPVVLRFADGKTADYEAVDLDLRKKDKDRKKRRSGASSSDDKAKKRKAQEVSSSSDTDDDNGEDWTPYTSDCELRPGQTGRVLKTPRTGVSYNDRSGLGQVATIIQKMHVPPLMKLLMGARLGGKTPKPVKMRFADGNVVDYDAADLDIRRKDKKMKKPKKEESDDKKTNEWIPYTRGVELQKGQTVRVSNPPRTGINYDDCSGLGKVGQVVQVPEIPPIIGLIHRALSSSGQADRKPVEIRFSDGHSVRYDAMDLDIKKSKDEKQTAKRPTSTSGADKVDEGDSSEWAACTDARVLRVGKTVRVVNPPRSGSNYRDKSGLGRQATIVEIPTGVERADPHDLSIILRFANGKIIQYDADDLDIKAEAQHDGPADRETNESGKSAKDDSPDLDPVDSDEWVPYTPDHELRIGETVRVVNPQRSDFTYPDCSGLGHVATILELPVVPLFIELMSRQTHKPVKMRFADGRVLVYDGADLDVKRNDHQ